MNSSLPLKTAAKISLGSLTVLLIGSIIFWKERILFSDASFIAFEIINRGTLQTQVGRYGAFITQLFPYTASKLHLPLHIVLLLYSVSFNLFYLFTGWILYRMKQYPLTLLLAFYLTLYVSDTYFWTNNEVHQGITWMFLNFGVLQFLYERLKNDRVRFLLISLPVFILLTFIAIYTHPLVMLSFGFLWGFFVLAKQGFFYTRLSIFYIVAAILTCVFKFLQSQANSYDGGFVHNILHTTLPAILNTFKSNLANDFWHGGLTNYWLLWLIFITGSVSLWIQKRYKLFAYTLISCLCYFILMCLAFYPSKAFYIESEWMSLAIWGSAGFTYFVVPRLKASYVMGALIFIFAVRAGYISFSSKKFTGRVQFLEKTYKNMSKMNSSKLVVVNDGDVLDNELLLTWGLPYETSLFSALKGDRPTKVMSYLKQEKIEQYNIPGVTRCIFSTFGPFCNNELNTHYFRFDTSEHYTVITLEELNKN